MHEIESQRPPIPGPESSPGKCLIQAGGVPGDHAPIAIAEYVRHLRSAGNAVLDGAPGTFWRRGEAGSLVRLPTIEAAPPSQKELRRVFSAGRAVLASHLLCPDSGHPANALLYLCRNRQYSLESRPKNVRSDIRRALESLDFSWVSQDDLLANGFAPYHDSRVRNGLTDGTEADFERRFGHWLQNPANHFIGAWRTGRLVAFFTVTAVDDWIEIGGHSEKTSLQWRPNNGLIHCLLDYYLAGGRAATVSYGLSSVQENTNAAGLHEFKIRVGFEAIPMHRAFIVHPLLRPFVGRTTLAATRQLLRLSPGNRWLRKASGSLRMLVEPNAQAPSAKEAQ